MRAGRVPWTILVVITLTLGLSAAPPQKPVTKGKGRAVPPLEQKLEVLKRDLAAEIDGMKDLTQQMVDSIFSFARARLPGIRDLEVPARTSSRRDGFTIADERRRDADRMDGAHGAPASRSSRSAPTSTASRDVAEARRRLPRAPFIEGAPGHGEGHNTGMPLQHHRGARGQEDHGAREDPRHDHGVARHRRGAARRQGAVRARRRLQGRGHLPVLAHLVELRRRLGRRRRHRRGVGRIHVHGPERPRGRRAVAGPQRARRGGADGHRLELPPRAPAPVAALALRHHQRRRPAERRPADGERLVLLPRDRLPAHQGDVGDRATRWRRARP